MSKRFLVILTAVGLLFAILGTVLFPSSLEVQQINLLNTLGLLVFGMIAAASAGRALLGRGVTTRVARLAVPLLAAISYALFSSAASSLLLSSHLLDALGKGSEPVSSSFVVAVIIGGVAYLAAATLYGFAGIAQGVPAWSRVGLLLVLLLAVIPVLNVLGLAGFLVTALVRKPRTKASRPARRLATAG
ncbi:MAG: hypothetical protein QOK08_1131 [Actinomycetota bacterium]|nr:hypothetical protein [Actinomycetota bacterium]MDQ1561542.1 hypothetical protein [Actinomycetota bacterium]